DEVVFVDAGGNWEGVRCPVCDADLEEWWADAVDKSYQTHFQHLDVVLPCCGAVISLNDLKYPWAVGFARFVLSARDPDIPELPREGVAALEKVLGCGVRAIWVHY